MLDDNSSEEVGLCWSEAFVLTLPNKEVLGEDGEKYKAGGPCIASEHLTHLGRNELAFEEDELQRVLCDTYGSCATPGHVVVVHGRSMMMSTYCEKADCIGRVMHVNSPRYIKGLRLSSKTVGLTFSAFAARYQTRVEENALRLAVRLGF